MKTETRIKRPGPVQLLNRSARSAVWPGDRVKVLCRVGSSRLCEIAYDHGDRTATMIALVPKRYLKTRPKSAHNALETDSRTQPTPSPHHKNPVAAFLTQS